MYYNIHSSSLRWLASLPFLFGPSLRGGGHGSQFSNNMRKAIGFVIILWALSQFLSNSFHALDAAASQSLKTVETAARVAEIRLIEIK